MSNAHKYMESIDVYYYNILKNKKQIKCRNKLFSPKNGHEQSPTKRPTDYLFERTGCGRMPFRYMQIVFSLCSLNKPHHPKSSFEIRGTGDSTETCDG